MKHHILPIVLLFANIPLCQAQSSVYISNARNHFQAGDYAKAQGFLKVYEIETGYKPERSLSMKIEKCIELLKDMNETINEDEKMKIIIQLESLNPNDPNVLSEKRLMENGDALQQLKLGILYYKAQNFSNALIWFMKSADSGNSTAQYNLGYLFQNGIGTEKNMYQAFNWYRKAAEQNNASAQNSLGYCYQNGLGTDTNFTDAVFWYRKAAELGNASAQNNLGFCCLTGGDGLEKNPEESFKWFTKAAEQGNSNAQFNLGNCYQYGYGTDIDASLATNWYRKAAEQGNHDAEIILNDM